MAFLAYLTLTLSVLSTPAIAQSSTVTSTSSQSTSSDPVIAFAAPVFVAQSQAVVGSFVGSSSSISTIVLGCPDGTDPQSCYFSPSLTVTAGPSTFGFIASATETGTTATTSENCSWSSGAGNCTLATFGTSADGITFSVGETSPFVGAAQATQAVTITAGDPGDLVTSSSTTSSSSTRSNGATTSTTATSTSHNDAKALAPGVVGAGILGLAAVFL